ncbi:unnamed protein product [Prorocentrum cordatum]|uniref:Reverse transcriptase domain-containing protein n=1 Tax=Prorocentrum cordatum TaxID=2364126 RepID=A0ABN9QGM6_9DINO|nr:unnamed protein product [Polarella glacialis]
MVDPSASELRGLNNLQDIQNWVGLQPTVWAALQSELGEVAQIREVVNASSIRKVKMSTIFDQADDSEIAPWSAQRTRTVMAAFKAANDDEDPEPDEDVTGDQLAALEHRIQTGACPCPDFGVWRPYGQRFARTLKLVVHHITPAGDYRPYEVPGPPTFAEWLPAFRVFSVGMRALGAATTTRLQLYQNKISKFNNTYGEVCWWLVALADQRMRSERMERIRRRAEEKYAAAQVSGAPHAFDPKMPWDYCFKAAAADSDFWDEELGRKATLWVTHLRTRQQLTDDGTGHPGPGGGPSGGPGGGSGGGGGGGTGGNGGGKRGAKRAWGSQDRAASDSSQFGGSGRGRSGGRGGGRGAAGGGKGNAKHPDGRWRGDERGKPLCWAWNHNANGCSEVCANGRAGERGRPESSERPADPLGKMRKTELLDEGGGASVRQLGTRLRQIFGCAGDASAPADAGAAPGSSGAAESGHREHRHDPLPHRGRSVLAGASGGSPPRVEKHADQSRGTRPRARSRSAAGRAARIDDLRAKHDRLQEVIRQRKDRLRLAGVRQEAEASGRGRAAQDAGGRSPPKAPAGTSLANPTAGSRAARRAEENEACIGGLRAPWKAVKKLPMLAETGRKIGAFLDEFLDQHPDFLDLPDGGERAQELVRDPRLRAARGDLRRALGAKEAKAHKRTPWKRDIVEAHVAASQDPEVHLGDWLRDGAPIGVARPVPSCGIFPQLGPAAKERTQAHEVLSLLEAHGNYKSFEEARVHAEPEIERIIKEGFAVRFKSWKQVVGTYGPVAASRLACIVKDRKDGAKKARIIIDLRRSGVNRCVQVDERIVLPRPKDILSNAMHLLRHAAEDEEVEAMALDFKDAFHTLPVHADELPYGVAKVFDGEYVVFRTVVFGGEASPLLWGRAAAYVMRGAQSIFEPEHLLGECYVDDPLVLAVGTAETRRRRFAKFLLWPILLGLRLSWAKVSRGRRVEWCGVEYRLVSRYVVQAVLAQAFAQEFKAEIEQATRRPLIARSELRRIAGRASWATGLVPTMRSFIDSLWATLADLNAASKGDSGIPWIGRDPQPAAQTSRIIVALAWLHAFLEGVVTGGDPGRTVDVREWFRQPSIEIVCDASPWGLGAVLWVDGAARAYLFDEVGPADVEELGVEKGSCKAQAVLEALAIAVAARTWLPRWAQHRTGVRVKSDSMAALGALGKMASPTPAINKIAREIALDVAQTRYGIDVLEHVPGELNDVADALSRAFEPGGRFALPEVLRQAGCTRTPVAARDGSWWRSMALTRTVLDKGAGSLERGLPRVIRVVNAPADALHEGPRRVDGAQGRRGREEEERSSGGVPDALLGPGPAPARRRWDETAAAAPAKRACLAGALQVIGCPQRSAAAAAEFREATLAVTTRPVMDSYTKALVSLARAGGFDLLPFTPEKAYRIGGALRAAGYRSTACYLERYKQMHVEEDYDWSVRLHGVMRGCRRASIRGLGPPTHAAVFTLESWLVAAHVKRAHAQGGPTEPGRFITVGTWWMLREIEVALLTIERVRFLEETDSVAVDLGVTKKDIQGCGCTRVHSCICQCRPEWQAICPVCVVRAQLQKRRADQAEPCDPLFADAAGYAVVKRAAVATMRALLVPEGAGQVNGHSLRRMGAQLLAAAGVEQWLVEWFGRWGSDAVKRYVEDARSRAPQARSLALRAARSDANVEPGPATMAAAGARDAPLAREGEEERQGGAAGPIGLEELVGRLVEERMREREERLRLVSYALGKTHVARARACESRVPRERSSLCGWHFGGLPQSALTFHEGRADLHDACRKCVRLAASRGWPVDCAAAGAGGERGEGSSSSQSSDSGSGSDRPPSDDAEAGRGETEDEAPGARA